jgi:hypothetical protein
MHSSKRRAAATVDEYFLVDCANAKHPVKERRGSNNCIVSGNSMQVVAAR